MSESETPFPNAASPEVREFLADAEAYRAATTPELAKSSLSSILFGSGVQLERMETGCDVTTARLNAARERLEQLRQGGRRTRPKRIA